MADLEQLRRRQSGVRSSDLPDQAGGQGVQVVQVYSGGSIPSAAPGIFLCHPVQVTCSETEGATPAFTVDTTRSLSVLVVGDVTPIIGTRLIARLIDGFWVATRRSGGTGGGGDVVILPGCPCASSPRTLYQSVSSPSLNNQVFQNCTLVYGTTPSSLLGLGIGSSSYLSTVQFQDYVTGDWFWYYFTCNSGNYVLTRVYATSVYGSPFRDLVRYRWPIGYLGNSCNPFSLLHGQIFPGGDPACVVTITS